MDRPTVLIFSDDLTGYGHRHIRKDNPNFTIDFITRRSEIEDVQLSMYDAILIDYGLLGDDVYLVRRFIKSRKQLAWYGALAHRCNGDAKKIFPNEEYIHSLLCADLSELGWLLEEMFPGASELQERALPPASSDGE